MILRFGKIVVTFIKSILLYKFNNKENLPELYYSGYCLFKNSYRYPSRSKSDFLILFRIYKNILFSILFKKINIELFKSNSDVAIFDGSLGSSKLRRKYVYKFSGLKTKLVISKDNLLSYYSFSSFAITILFLSFSFIPVFLLSIFSKNKLTYPLLISEIIECFILSELLYKHKIKQLFYFNIYERDSNVVAYYLMSRAIYINKIPSEVPIYFWNQIIIANTLCICFPYQLEEYSQFKETIFIDQIKNWGPEQIVNAPKYVFEKNKNENKPKYKIGYYSSGYWLRSKNGNVSLGDFFSVETELIKILDEYAKIFNIQIIFYLHPKELKEENLVLTKNYYSEIGKNKNIHIPFDKVPSVLTLNDVDLGISIKSTLMFERIYYGYKTLFYCFKQKDFPIKKSSLENIFIDKYTFNEIISKSLSLKTYEFFDYFNIMKYTKYLQL